MVIRRAFYYWQFPAAVVLPLWLLIGWGFFADSGWTFLFVLIYSPALFIAQIGVGALIALRSAVRGERAVSWTDVAVLACWHATIIGLGFFGATADLFAVLSVLAFLLAFWMSVLQFLRMGRVRMTTVRMTGGSGGYVPTDGETIVIQQREPDAD